MLILCSQIYEEIGLHLGQEECQIVVFFDGNRLTCHGKILRREEALRCCFHDRIRIEDIEGLETAEQTSI